MSGIHFFHMAVQLTQSFAALQNTSVIFAIQTVSTPQAGRVNNAISVMTGLMESIMIRIPIIVATEVINWVKLCWRVVEMVSISLVTRLNISPWVRPSKYFKGSRSSFLHFITHGIDCRLRHTGHDIGHGIAAHKNQYIQDYHHNKNLADVFQIK